MLMFRPFEPEFLPTYPTYDSTMKANICPEIQVISTDLFCTYLLRAGDDQVISSVRYIAARPCERGIPRR
jgi:hypothetical protein